MKLKLLRALRRVNFMHEICDHVVGEHHTHRHRLIAGACVMLIGVVIAHQAAHVHPEFLAWLVDGVGYGIHAFGATPYLETAVAIVAAVPEINSGDTARVPGLDEGCGPQERGGASRTRRGECGAEERTGFGEEEEELGEQI